MTTLPGDDLDAPKESRAEALRRLIGSGKATAVHSADSARGLPTRADFDRSLIAKMVMAVYVGAVSLYLGWLVGHGLSGPGDFSAVSNSLSDLNKTAVVPIVTLVLGYYFGRSGRT